jgi:hypothetical protein
MASDRQPLSRSLRQLREAMAGRANGTGAAITADTPGKPARCRVSSRLIVVQNRDLVALFGPVVPVLVAASGTDAPMRFLDFFATQIENDNTGAT